VAGYKSVNDSEFGRLVALRDAYRIMERFLADFYARGNVPVLDLLSYLGLRPDGESSDPAAVYDFLKAAEAVLPREPDS